MPSTWSRSCDRRGRRPWLALGLHRPGARPTRLRGRRGGNDRSRATRHTTDRQPVRLAAQHPAGRLDGRRHRDRPGCRQRARGTLIRRRVEQGVLGSLDKARRGTVRLCARRVPGLVDRRAGGPPADRHAGNRSPPVDHPAHASDAPAVTAGVRRRARPCPGVGRTARHLRRRSTAAGAAARRPGLARAERAAVARNRAPCGSRRSLAAT